MQVILGLNFNANERINRSIFFLSSALKAEKLPTIHQKKRMKYFYIFSAICALLIVSTQRSNAQCELGETEVQIIISTDSWGYECYWQITAIDDNCGISTVVEGGNLNQIGCTGGGNQDATLGQGYNDNTEITVPDICLTLGNSYTLHYVDDYGDGGAFFQILIGGYPVYEYTGMGIGGTFDFLVEEPSPYDAAGHAIMTYSYSNPGEIPIVAEFFNHGTEVITSVEMTYEIDNGSAITASINGLNVDPFSSFIIEHPTAWNENVNGAYNVQASISSINGNADENPANDLVEKEITIGPGIPNILDSYIGLVPESIEIAGVPEGVDHPRDLDFHPTLTRKELWVILKSTEDNGGKTIKISNAGEPNQTELLQQDENAWHFMSLPTGIAFGENGNFATSPGVYDANHDGGSPFTGPTLWSSDPEIYAQPSGGNGSHLDMLHESPYSMGIAHEIDNKYWVTCGDHNEIMSYDFKEDHGPGNSDHSDGIIYKYPIPGYDEDSEHEVPDHLVLDKNTGWLYVCNSQQNRVIRINTNTGTPGSSLPQNEPVEVYQYMTDFEWEVFIDFGLDEPTGIDIVEDRLIVSNYNTGDVMLYDISTGTANLLTTIPTGNSGIMGIKVGPDGLIWYVNSITNKVMMITLNSVSVEEVLVVHELKVYPNPATDNINVSISNAFKLSNAKIQVYDFTGRIVQEQLVFGNGDQRIETNNWSQGIYSIALFNGDTFIGQSKIVIE